MASNDDWQARSDHSTLREASDIVGNKDRMKGVRKHHVQQSKALKSMDPMLGGNKVRGNTDYKKLMGTLKGKC